MLPSQVSRPSIRVAFKVAQLVALFCRRVKTKSSSRRPFIKPEHIKEELCEEWERVTARSIDRYLGHSEQHKKSNTTFDHADFQDRLSSCEIKPWQASLSEYVKSPTSNCLLWLHTDMSKVDSTTRYSSSTEEALFADQACRRRQGVPQTWVQSQRTRLVAKSHHCENVASTTTSGYHPSRPKRSHHRLFLQHR